MHNAPTSTFASGGVGGSAPEPVFVGQFVGTCSPSRTLPCAEWRRAHDPYAAVSRPEFTTDDTCPEHALCSTVQCPTQSQRLKMDSAAAVRGWVGARHHAVTIGTTPRQHGQPAATSASPSAARPPVDRLIPAAQGREVRGPPKRSRCPPGTRGRPTRDQRPAYKPVDGRPEARLTGRHASLLDDRDAAQSDGQYVADESALMPTSPSCSLNARSGP
jgi:hypothetical protein